MNPINEEHSIVTPSGAGRATDAEGRLFVAAPAQVARHRSELLGAVEVGGGVAANWGSVRGHHYAGGS